MQSAPSLRGIRSNAECEPALNRLVRRKHSDSSADFEGLTGHLVSPFWFGR